MTDERRNGRSDNGEDGDPAGKKPRDPGTLDFKKAREGLKKIVEENQKWLKEMANR